MSRFRRSGRDVEVRDVKGATLATGWTSFPGRPQLPDWDADMAYRAQKSQWLVGRAIELTADRISSWPFRMGADPDKPMDYNTKAKLAQLLGPAPGSPNPEFSARALWKWAITNYLVAGRFGWEIERGRARTLPSLGGPIRPGQASVTIQKPDSSGIIGLWPLVTGILYPIESDWRNPVERARRRYFSGFELRPYGSTQYVQYRREEVAYGWSPDPQNPRQSVSALQSCALNVNVIFEIDTYSFAFMQNDATPATMMVHSRFADPAKRDDWRAKILGNHRGAENAGKVMFNEVDVDENGKVAGALDVIPMGANNRDSQLSIIYDQQLQAVSGGLGVPMSRLDASGRTYDNAEQEDWNWHEDKLLPLSRELADIVNRELSPRFDDGLVGWFDLSGVRSLKPRMSTGVNFAAIEGDMLRDERRMFAGLGPVDLEALKKEKEEDAQMATPLLLPPPGDSLGRLPASGIQPSIGHPGAAKAGIESQSKTPPAADTSSNASTGNAKVPAARPASRAVPSHDWTGNEDDAAEDDQAPCEVCNAPYDGHGKRHAGAPGHDHVSSGHHPSGSLADVLVKHRDAVARRYTSMLGGVLGDLDARAVTSTQARANGKRGQQLLRDGEVRADALFEPEFWTAATRQAVQPVFYAVAAAAELAMGTLFEPLPDLDAWASDRATAFAEARVAVQLAHFGPALVPCIRSTAGDQVELMAEAADVLRTGVTSSQVIADAWDDAVRFLQPSASVESVRALLVRYAAGEIDIEQARLELESAT